MRERQSWVNEWVSQWLNYIYIYIYVCVCVFKHRLTTYNLRYILLPQSLMAGVPTTSPASQKQTSPHFPPVPTEVVPPVCPTLEKQNPPTHYNSSCPIGDGTVVYNGDGSRLTSCIINSPNVAWLSRFVRRPIALARRNVARAAQLVTGAHLPCYCDKGASLRAPFTIRTYKISPARNIRPSPLPPFCFHGPYYLPPLCVKWPISVSTCNVSDHWGYCFRARPRAPTAWRHEVTSLLSTVCFSWQHIVRPALMGVHHVNISFSLWHW